MFQRVGPEGRRADVESEGAFVALHRREVGNDVVERPRPGRPDGEGARRRSSRRIAPDLRDQLVAPGLGHVRRIVENPQRGIARLQLQPVDEFAEVPLRDVGRGVEQRAHRVEGVAVRLDARRDGVLRLLGLQLEIVLGLLVHALAHEVREARTDDEADREDEQREPQPREEGRTEPRFPVLC